jgi:hypothetical protein
MKKLLVYINFIYVVSILNLDVNVLQKSLQGNLGKTKLIKLKEMLQKYVSLKIQCDEDWDYIYHGNDWKCEVN